MVEDRIGYRYAKSIFDLAKEKNLLEQVKTDMTLVHNVCEDNRDFVLMLKSPLIPADKKKNILHSVFKGKFVEEFTELLLDILVRKGREKYLDYVAKSFLQLYDIENHIQRGKLISATPLSDAQIKEIVAAVQKKTGSNFEVETEIDPELIGGFILRIGNTLFDGSVATSLRQVDQDFNQNTYIKLY